MNVKPRNLVLETAVIDMLKAGKKPMEMSRELGHNYNTINSIIFRYRHPDLVKASRKDYTKGRRDEESSEPVGGRACYVNACEALVPEGVKFCARHEYRAPFNVNRLMARCA